MVGGVGGMHKGLVKKETMLVFAISQARANGKLQKLGSKKQLFLPHKSLLKRKQNKKQMHMIKTLTTTQLAIKRANSWWWKTRMWNMEEWFPVSKKTNLW